MKPVLITPRVLPPTEFGEVRTALDVRWAGLLASCGLVPVVVPLDVELALTLAEQVGAAGLVLSGGEDLEAYGGPRTGRDALEVALLEWAASGSRPVLGVCRGMQLVQHLHGARLVEVEGHVATPHTIKGAGGGREVTCYHRWGTTEDVPGLVTTVRRGQVVEAVRSTDGRVAAMMWHPERGPADAAELRWISRHLGGVAA